jgi:predicted ribosomally synthesized peptide with SipW-like signal peptide
MSKKKLELTRRRVLGGLGTIGVASAAAGLGTSAYLNDTESFDNNMVTAGTLDLLVDYYSYWDQGSAGMGQVSGTADGEAVTAELSDVKPGDNGIIAFCPRIETNPAYLWLCGELTSSSENKYTEPEPEDDNGEGELEENIQVDVNYCTVADDVGEPFDPEDVTTETTAWSGTLAEFLATAQTGIPLDGEADGPGAESPIGFHDPGDQASFAGTGDDDPENPCLCIDWDVPTTVGNEIQGDSLKFDLQFHALQARHNDGTMNPCIGDLVLLDNNEDSPGLEDNGPEGGNEPEPYIEWTLGTDSATDSLEDNQMEVTFSNPANGTMVFDYRVDGESGDDTQYTGQTIGSGPLAGQDFGQRYNWVVVPSGGSQTVTLTAFDAVELGARVGSEQDYYIDWIRFDVV